MERDVWVGLSQPPLGLPTICVPSSAPPHTFAFTHSSRSSSWEECLTSAPWSPRPQPRESKHLGAAALPPLAGAWNESPALWPQVGAPLEVKLKLHPGSAPSPFFLPCSLFPLASNGSRSSINVPLRGPWSQDLLLGSPT